jgi:hypothetical protein
MFLYIFLVLFIFLTRLIGSNLYPGEQCTFGSVFSLSFGWSSTRQVSVRVKSVSGSVADWCVCGLAGALVSHSEGGRERESECERACVCVIERESEKERQRKRHRERESWCRVDGFHVCWLHQHNTSLTKADTAKS